MVDKALTDTPPAVLPPDPEKSGWHWIRGSGGNTERLEGLRDALRAVSAAAKQTPAP